MEDEQATCAGTCSGQATHLGKLAHREEGFAGSLVAPDRPRVQPDRCLAVLKGFPVLAQHEASRCTVHPVHGAVRRQLDGVPVGKTRTRVRRASGKACKLATAWNHWSEELAQR